MRVLHVLNRTDAKSLAYQIQDAQQQVLNRKANLAVRTTALGRKVYQQMTAPASLLLAGGVGFVLGELTQRQCVIVSGSAQQPRPAETSPLKTALSLLASARTLYTALPLAWMAKSISGSHRHVKQKPSHKPAPPIRHPGPSRH